MRSLFILVIFLMAVSLLKAQPDAKAKQILDEVSAKTRSFPSITADFIFSLENIHADIRENNEGTIKVKGSKYRLELPEIGLQVYSDGITLWNYMAEGNQVTISAVEEGGDDLMDPASVFTIYEKGFRSKLVDDKRIGSVDCYQIELYPDSDEFEVTKIVLFIGKQDKMIKSASLFGTDGNLYGIEIKKMNTTDDLPDAFFVFNPADYSDLVVIDFR